uniref:glucose-6-phosphatase n=1 Tax=Romanomermis culicivorax TaxID=13658 RepID=A0A915L0T8_ROMCU
MMINMDVLHVNGAHFIRFLQSSWSHKPSVELLTRLPQYVADPDTMLTTIFPLLLCVDRMLALRFILTLGSVDSINNIIKWVLQGERPYWWVREALHKGDDVPDLDHYPLTCETGPGSPSGHAMLCSAIGFVFLSYFCTLLKNSGYKYERNLRRCLSVSYLVLTIVVSLVRLHIATHFPHQVLLGTVFGLLLGWIICKLPLNHFQPQHYRSFALGLLLSAFGTYYALIYFGINPTRTLHLALKHCDDKSFVKMSTTPWHAVYRNFAVIFACGSIVESAAWATISRGDHLTHDHLFERVALGALSILFVQTACNFGAFFSKPYYIFYIVTVIKNFTYVYVCLNLMPSIVIHLSRSAMEKHNYRAPPAMTNGGGHYSNGHCGKEKNNNEIDFVEKTTHLRHRF